MGNEVDKSMSNRMKAFVIHGGISPIYFNPIFSLDILCLVSRAFGKRDGG